MIYQFTVPGPARPKQRPRVVSHGGKVTTYTPDDHGWKPMVVVMARQAGVEVAEGPVAVNIHVWRRMPASWSKKKREAMKGNICTTRPDIINVAMHVYDSLTGVAYHDDSQAYGSQVAYWAYEDSTNISLVTEEEK